MVKLLHWCALRMSDLGELLFNLGGSIECWCDSRAERKRWLAYSKKHKITVQWLDVPKLDPKDLAMPMPGAYPQVKPRPITMLDEGE